MQFKAPVDSLADISCVGRDTVVSLGLSITPPGPSSGKHLAMAAKGVLVPRIGTVDLRIRCGRFNLVHTFEVLDMQYALLVGLDLMPKLGFFIGGVPTQFPGDQPDELAAKLAAQQEALLRARQAPWELSDQHDGKAMEDLRKALRPLLQANAAIDPISAFGCRPQINAVIDHLGVVFDRCVF